MIAAATRDPTAPALRGRSKTPPGRERTARQVRREPSLPGSGCRTQAARGAAANTLVPALPRQILSGNRCSLDVVDAASAVVVVAIDF